MILGTVSDTVAADGGSKSATSQVKLQDELNRFLNLLVTQLKHQDPLDPLDTNEFTAQLVQFAGVEQQIQQNANLEKLLNLQETTQVAAMVNFIGTTVEVTGDTVPLEDGRAEFTYALGVNATDVTITVMNSSGLTVFVGEGETGAGKHSFVWDGKSAGGVDQPDGAYTVVVGALDRAGNLIEVEQTVFGRVTGAGVDEGAVSLFLSDVTVSMDDVLSVKETPASALPAAASSIGVTDPPPDPTL
ncbi:MAG: flagellar hook assembly protein FlgD [Alphaproteobacteria bacterium]|nr:flagellar hook assembly protein FlgD [Alphaproteobacteria bacterium]